MATGSPFPKTKTITGYMKFSDSNSEPKNRYFVLSHNFLLGAKFKDSAKISIAILIESAKIDSVNTNPFAFIITRKNKKYHFIASNLVEAKEWMYALKRATTLKIKDIYRLCHEIAQDYSSNITIIDAQHKETKAKVIIKAINKKKCNKSSLPQQIPMIKKMKKYQNIIDITDVFETKKYLYLILRLSVQTAAESIICDIIHQIVLNAINKNENGSININEQDIAIDYWMIGLIGYIMASGRIPSWSPLNKTDGIINNNAYDMNITECMQIFITDLLDCHLIRKYTLNEILLLTSSEALFLRACNNFNSREHNLIYLFTGFVRKICTTLYNKTPYDVIRVCIGYTFDDNRWRKVDGNIIKSQEKLDKAKNRLHYYTPRKFITMRRLWQIKVKSVFVDRGPFLKVVVLHIDNLGVIEVPGTPINDDIVTILYVRGMQDMIKIALNGKEFIKRTLSENEAIAWDHHQKVSGLSRQTRYYPCY